MLSPDPDLTDPFCVASRIDHEQARRILNDLDRGAEVSRARRAARDAVMAGIIEKARFSSPFPIG
jgi:hypothetical protein